MFTFMGALCNVWFSKLVVTKRRGSCTCRLPAAWSRAVALLTSPPDWKLCSSVALWTKTCWRARPDVFQILRILRFQVLTFFSNTYTKKQEAKTKKTKNWTDQTAETALMVEVKQTNSESQKRQTQNKSVYCSSQNGLWKRSDLRR